MKIMKVAKGLIWIAALLPISLPAILSGRAVAAGISAPAQAAPAADAPAKAGKQKKTKDQAAPAPADEYVGSETCAGCHTDFHPDKLPYHRAIDTNKRLNWSGRTCEACHGPGKAHAESGDPKLIFSFRRATATQVMEKCLSCHAQGLRSNSHLFDAHSKNNVGCISCHTVHSAPVGKLLVSKPESFCVTCHTNVRAEFYRPFRHRLNEGMIGCLDCHDPHGSPQLSSNMKAQLRRSGANEIACLKCHTDKRGPFTFEHVPVRAEGCVACHEPHGSVNQRMLNRAEVRFVCLDCHTFGTTTLADSPPAFHDLRTPRFKNCTVCHNRIHGSYVDEFFER